MPRQRRVPPPPRKHARSGWWPSLLILLAGTVAYANSLSGPFVFDDYVSIVENPAIRSLAAVTSDRVNSPLAGRPVVGLTFALNFAFGDLDVTGYHLTNVAIHLGSALLLFGLVHRTLNLPRLRDQYGAHARDLATAIALVWTVHPLNTEAVNYVTQRTELLFGFFYLLTLYAVARAADGVPTFRPAGLWHVAAVVSCALGMASKESMVTAPIVVVLYERIFVYGAWRHMFAVRWRAYFHAALALTWVVLAVLVLSGPRANSAGFSTNVSVWTYLLNQAGMIVRYLRLAFWPSGLVVNYGPPVTLLLRDVLPQALLVVSLLIASLALSWRRPLLGFLGIWVFLTLAPTSSILPIATEVGAERRMYVPLMASVAAAVGGLYGLTAGRRAGRDRTTRRLPGLQTRTRPTFSLGAVVVGAIVLILGTLTVARNRDYASALTIAQQDFAAWPTDYTQGVVGTELARLGRDEESIALLTVAARSDPRARYNLGVALFNTGRYDDAIRHLTALAEEYPMREEAPWARRIAGHAYSLQERWTAAMAEFRMVLAMTPHDAEARRLYARALNAHGIERGTAGEHATAAEAFRASLAQDPGGRGVRHNLATALLDSGDVRAAASEARTALEQNPTDPSLYNLLGRALAMQGQVKEALINLEAAAKLRPDDAALAADVERVRRFVSSGVR